MSVITLSARAMANASWVAGANHHVIKKRECILLYFAALGAAAKSTASRVNAANIASAAKRRKVRFNGAHVDAVAVGAELPVKVGEPIIRRTRSVRTCINRSVRRRRGTTTTNQQHHKQNFAHSAIVHEVHDVCAAIGKAVQS